MPAVDPTAALRGLEWSVGSLEGDLEAGRAVGGAGGAAGAAAPGGVSFGDVMAKQIGSLADLQTDAASQSQALALGQAEDPASAVLAVERARLAMQLAVSVRTKLTDAFNDVMRTQV